MTATAMRLATGIVVTLGAVSPTFPQPNDATEGLRQFTERIGQYAALHERLEVSLPPLRPSRTAQSLLLNRTYLAAAIRAARPNARQGDIFAPPVERLFRQLLTDALAGTDTNALLGHLYAEHMIVTAFHPRVYDPYPDWATHEMPPALLQVLPPTPHDLEYRLIDHDLLLLDIHANLIVDVLFDAIPRVGS